MYHQLRDLIIERNITLLFLRHAESQYNILKIEAICGQIDCPLSDKGFKQAKQVQDWLSQQKIDLVKCSSAVRCRSTIGNFFKPEQCEFLNELLEINQGDWTGKLRQEIYTKEIFAQIDADPMNFKAPNGESKYDVESRMIKIITKIVVEAGPNSTVLICSHGTAISCLLRGFLEKTYSQAGHGPYVQRNGSVIQLIPDIKTKSISIQTIYTPSE